MRKWKKNLLEQLAILNSELHDDSLIREQNKILNEISVKLSAIIGKLDASIMTTENVVGKLSEVNSRLLPIQGDITGIHKQAIEIHSELYNIRKNPQPIVINPPAPQYPVYQPPVIPPGYPWGNPIYCKDPNPTVTHPVETISETSKTTTTSYSSTDSGTVKPPVIQKKDKK